MLAISKVVLKMVSTGSDVGLHIHGWGYFFARLPI